MRLRTALRLFVSVARVQSALPRRFHTNNVNAAVHRFEELIAGRPYLIEVTAVAADRWRACIMRLPGVPTALMPFYGATPDEAASQLSEWLTRAHARAAGPSPTV
jgi:glutathione S-transferase